MSLSTLNRRVIAVQTLPGADGANGQCSVCLMLYPFSASLSRLQTDALLSQVNPQLKGHLKGALNNGATVEQVQAIRNMTVRLCEAAGMKRLAETDMSGWGWRTDVANL